MSQIVAFKREDFGIIFADSNIVRADNTPVSGENRKVFKGKDFVIASAGIGYGIYIMEGLIKSAKDFDASDINYISSYLLKIGNRQYQDFISGNKDILSDYLRIYFVVIAFDEKRKLNMTMIGTEGTGNFREFPVGNVLTVPKRIGLELGLTKKQNEDRNEIIYYIEKQLQKIGEIDKTITPPFIFEIIESR
ncbi:MAG: hypothetical protein N2999_02650 [Proteobacteria bacterium]|nr:hypothetical protein [Pseudomonadota bacterium]